MDVCLHMIHICNLDQIGPCTGIQVWKCLVLLNAQTPPCTQQFPTTHLSIHLSNNAECLWSAQSSTNAWPVVTWPQKKGADFWGDWNPAKINRITHSPPSNIPNLSRKTHIGSHSPLDLSLSHYKPINPAAVRRYGPAGVGPRWWELSNLETWKTWKD